MQKNTIHSKAHREIVGMLKRRRIELRITQAQLAAKVGRNRKWLQRIESCDRRLDIIETIVLFRVLDLDINRAVCLVGKDPYRGSFFTWLMND